MNFISTTLKTLLLALAAFSTVAMAEGQLMVTPATIGVEPDGKAFVTLKNMGNAPLYIKVDLMKINNPGQQPESKTAIGNLQHPEILANPSKLTLGPNQSRRVELVSIAETPVETAWRLYTIPVKSLKVVGKAEADKINTPMSVSIGYGVLVFHHPARANVRHELAHRCENGGMTLVNKGSVRELLTHVSLTPAPSAATHLGKEGNGNIKVAVFPGTDIHLPATQLQGKSASESFSVSCL